VDKLRVSLLGSTGMVGQKMVRILSQHPYIELVKVSASDSKVGKRYEEAVKWIEPGDIPEQVKGMRLVSTKPDDHRDVDFVLSALPNDVAEGVEVKLVKEGVNVVSNASPFRMDPDVPLINPEVNWDHLEVLKRQRESRGWKGVLVKNPNCTAAILSMPLKPIQDLRFGKIFIATLQSVSGAGYNGVPFMSIEGNVIPYIKGEEDKVPKEISKMTGEVRAGEIRPRQVEITATTTRVPVKVGHMGIIYAELQDEIEVEEIKKRLASFRSLPQEKGLPTAPVKPIVVFDQQDRPQPLLDVGLGRGMTVSVGRISQERKVLRMVVLGDNLVRGAAGITILTLEVMKELGYA